jgi:hypothetical protein
VAAKRPEVNQTQRSMSIFVLGWTGKAEDEDEVKVWEDNWDDDNIEDDFSQQLR